MPAHTTEQGFTLLDEPEPRPGRAAGRRLSWERALGFLLLVVIAAAAGGTWWQDQARFASYQAGRQAAAQNRWEAARAAFLAAGGYGDSIGRAAAASDRIRERDTLYAQATAEEGSAWALALRDWRAVTAIQPDFRDTVARTAAAQAQVYALALSGTVALRPAANPPGLYRYTAGGWVWLQGSDPASQVRGSGSACCVVYDIPVPTPSDGSGALLTGGPPPPAPAAPARRLMSAQETGGHLTFAPLALDPASADAVSWDAAGVLAAEYGRGTRPAGDPRLDRVWTPYAGMRLVYQSFGSPLAVPLAVPATPTTLLAVTVDDRREVLGDYRAATGPAPHTRLYLATFGSSTPAFLADRDAIVQAAWLSPDNNNLLVDEFSPLPAGGEEHRLVVLPLDGPRAPVVAAHFIAPRPAVAQVNWYSVTFLSAGPAPAVALVRGNPQLDSAVRLIDLADPARPRWIMDPGPGISRVIALPAGPGLILTTTDWAGEQLDHQYVDASGHATGLRWAQATRQQLRGVWQRGDRLVFALLVNGSDRGTGYRIASQPLGAAGNLTAAATLLHADDTAARITPAGGAGARQWAIGPGLFAAIRAGQLYAETYDGTVVLPLETGVQALYTPAP